MLDNFWDTPTYTPESLLKLHTDKSLLQTKLTTAKDAANVLWEEEQRIRKMLQDLQTKKYALQEEIEDTKKSYAKLSSIEIDFAEEMRKQAALAEAENRISQLEEELRLISEGRDFWDKVMPYQKEDLLYAINAWQMGMTGVLNANDMGLGKTFETIAFDFLTSKLFENKHGHKPRRIWVTKKSLINSTVRELKKWFPDAAILPLTGADKAAREFLVEIAYEHNAMVVCNYEALNTTPKLKEIHWDFVYADEVHRLKGGANSVPTKLWTDMRDLVFYSRNTGPSFFMPLSGSPIQNHPKDMWAYLHLFDPITFESARKFERDYCSWYNEGIRVNLDLLIKSMKSQVIRRTMPEVRDQLKSYLQDLIHDVREIEFTPSQRKVYDQMKNDFFIWLDEQQTEVITATVIIAQLNRLRQIALWPDAITDKAVGSAKIDEAMDIIEELTSNGEQVVVFSSQFNDPLYEIVRRCKEFYDLPVGLIVGGAKDVDGMCEDFRQGRLKVMCINAKSGGEGLNLQKSADWPGGACHVIMLDKWWNPKSNEQAIARVYRTGQTDIVTVHELIATESVDAFIESILADKTMMIDSVMEVKDLRKSKDEWKSSLRELL